MHGVCLALLVKRDGPAEQPGKPTLQWETGAAGNPQVFIRWNFSQRRDLAGYKVFRRAAGASEAELINIPEATLCACYIDMDAVQGAAYSVSVLYADGSESARSEET
jgi:hypothetical protein